jgi:spore maturation protein CgeB
VPRPPDSEGIRHADWEPASGWSRTHLVADHGLGPIREFEWRFPRLRSRTYDPDQADLDAMLEAADVLMVHEWNSPALIARLGRHGRRAGCRVLFHDTHHRSVTSPDEMTSFDLRDYSGVLASGEAIRQCYLDNEWCAQAWTWHEAADIRMFRPCAETPQEGDLVWIGNWGDEERRREVAEFLIEPVRQLRLSARVHGVRYLEAALAELARAGIDYRGWLPNWRVPDVFGRFRVTVHVPRSPYLRDVPGVPTIRVFEALACGIPLVCSPWHDAEGLFAPGRDYLIAQNGTDMRRKLRMVLEDEAMALELATHGMRTIHARHTCAHRVRQLLEIVGRIGGDARAAPESTQRKAVA